jgi:hypothetical protein
MLSDLRTILLRELDALRREIALYPDDEMPWTTRTGLPNTGGTLALHLVGNLRHFIGAQLGGTGYVRNREVEFSSDRLTRADILEEIDKARTDVDRTLRSLDPARLDEPVRLPFGDQTIVTRLLLLHLLAHLAYHLGQVDYHRRTVTGDTASANALSLRELGEP